MYKVKKDMVTFDCWRWERTHLYCNKTETLIPSIAWCIGEFLVFVTDLFEMNNENIHRKNFKQAKQVQFISIYARGYTVF